MFMMSPDTGQRFLLLTLMNYKKKKVTRKCDTNRNVSSEKEHSQILCQLICFRKKKKHHRMGFNLANFVMHR